MFCLIVVFFNENSLILAHFYYISVNLFNSESLLGLCGIRIEIKD